MPRKMMNLLKRVFWSNFTHVKPMECLIITEKWNHKRMLVSRYQTTNYSRFYYINCHPLLNTTCLIDLQHPERNLSIYDPVWSIWDDMFKSGVLYTLPKVWRFMRERYLSKKEEKIIRTSAGCQKKSSKAPSFSSLSDPAKRIMEGRIIKEWNPTNKL